MPLKLQAGEVRSWEVRKIAVIGPGIVGMPMAALLARSCLRGAFGDAARVEVVQRDSPTSGWKVGAINAGRSPIGGIEPGLEELIREAVAAGRLAATHDDAALSDADVVLVCVQTDKAGLDPDYGPLNAALSSLARRLARKPVDNVPLVVIESTLAPSSMATVVREHFRAAGLEDGRDVLLANSPNRVMPGRLIERVAQADKLAGGLNPATPGLVQRLYADVVTAGTVHATSSLTAEIVKTLENAYRDVRIAYAAEVARWCDDHDVDFFALRERVNERLKEGDAASYDAAAVPVGGLLVPTVGVGGHCLPKDGILLRWRYNRDGAGDPARSLIHAARDINDASPAHVVALAERAFGAVDGRRIAVLGAAYRFDSDDTRNSPALDLCRLLLDRGCVVALHDPYVRPTDQNLLRTGLDAIYTQDLDDALDGTEVVIACQPHKPYRDGGADLFRGRKGLVGVVDGCNAWRREALAGVTGYTGIGRGRRAPDAALVDAALTGFHAVEVGVANELRAVIDHLNARYTESDFERVDFAEVQRLAGTCATGCRIVDPGPVTPPAGAPEGFAPRLVRLAVAGRKVN